MTVDLLVGGCERYPKRHTHTTRPPLAQPYIGGAKGTAVGTIDASTGGPPTTLKCTPNRAQNPSPESNSAALSAHEFWSRLGGTGAKHKLAQSMQVCHYTNALCSWSVICILCAFSLNNSIPPFSWRPSLAGAPFHSRVRPPGGHALITPTLSSLCHASLRDTHMSLRANQESRQQST